MDTPKRYHSSMVILHWVIAILVFFNLYVGFFILRSRGGGLDFAARNTFQAATWWLASPFLLF